MNNILSIVQYFMQFKKKAVKFYDTFIFIKILNFRFSLEAFSNLHFFILTNCIGKIKFYRQN